MREENERWTQHQWRKTLQERGLYSAVEYYTKAAYLFDVEGALQMISSLLD